MLSRLRIERGRPYLREDGYEQRSPRSAVYNCFAWAAGDTHAWWEPDDPRFYPHDGPRYWPPGVPHSVSLESYIQAFNSIGYAECDTADLVPGFEKVALYADETGEPQHAARQIESGVWTSKLGELEDIDHNTLRGVEGRQYGTVVRILKRPRR